MDGINQITISKIWKILPIFEENPDNYIKYLSRVKIYLSGLDNEEIIPGIINEIRGLEKLGKNITHAEVKRTSFSCAGRIKREIQRRDEEG